MNIRTAMTLLFIMSATYLHAAYDFELPEDVSEAFKNYNGENPDESIDLDETVTSINNFIDELNILKESGTETEGERFCHKEFIKQLKLFAKKLFQSPPP